MGVEAVVLLLCNPSRCLWASKHSKCLIRGTEPGFVSEPGSGMQGNTSIAQGGQSDDAASRTRLAPGGDSTAASHQPAPRKADTAHLYLL